VGGGVVSYWRRGDQQPETIRGAELTCGTSPGLEHRGVVAMGGLSLASSRRRSPPPLPPFIGERSGAKWG
jgi:hypothetical protein